MAAHKELATLLGVLSNDYANFDAVSIAFHSAFGGKSSHFHLLSSAVLLLEEPDLLPRPEHRLNALYLLYALYRDGPISANPFAHVLVRVVDAPPAERPGRSFSLTPCERHFASTLLAGPRKDVSAVVPCVLGARIS